MEIDGRILLRGGSTEGGEIELGDRKSKIKYGYGDHKGGFHGVLLDDGTVQILERGEGEESGLIFLRTALGVADIEHISVAGNEQVLIVRRR